MIDIALRTALLADSNISGLITSNAIYPERLPRNFSGTGIVYQVSNSFPNVQSGSISQITDSRIQLDVYSGTYSALRTLTQALITYFNGKNGSLDTLTVSACFIRNVINSYEDETDLYRAIIELDLHIK